MRTHDGRKEFARQCAASAKQKACEIWREEVVHRCGPASAAATQLRSSDLRPTSPPSAPKPGAVPRHLRRPPLISASLHTTPFCPTRAGCRSWAPFQNFLSAWRACLRWEGETGLLVAHRSVPCMDVAGDTAVGDEESTKSPTMRSRTIDEKPDERPRSAHRHSAAGRDTGERAGRLTNACGPAAARELQPNIFAHARWVLRRGLGGVTAHPATLERDNSPYTEKERERQRERDRDCGPYKKNGVCTCIHTHMHTHTHGRAQGFIEYFIMCVCVCACVCVCMCVCVVFVCKCIYMHPHTHACVRARSRAFAHTTHTCTHKHTHMHTGCKEHTHTHAHTHAHAHAHTHAHILFIEGDTLRLMLDIDT
jgi:hypothetical protein